MPVGSERIEKPFLLNEYMCVMNGWTIRETNSFCLIHFLNGCMWKPESHYAPWCTKIQQKNSPFPWRIYCLYVSLYARIKKGQRQEVCKNMWIYIPGSTETSDYNKLKSNHSRGFISIIPHIKPVCLLLDQILKLLGSTVQKILRLRLWNIITLLISAGRCQQLRITLAMRQVKIYTFDWRQSFYS